MTESMKTYNIGLIGGGFMGKAHSLAYASMPMFFWPAPGIPVRKVFCDVNPQLARDGARRYGFEKAVSDWREVVEDPEIQVVYIATPNYLHAEIAVAAAKAGKHILCEKPIAVTAEEAAKMTLAAEENHVVNQLAFNYRRIPAVVLAKKFIEEGTLGKIVSYRGTYLSGGDTHSPMGWRQKKELAGYGALGDIGTHAIDLAIYLAGEFEAVNGILKTFVKERPLTEGGRELYPVENDDEAAISIRFKNGALGSIQASNNAWGRNNFLSFEIYGELGSMYFSYDRRDELQVCFSTDPKDRRGYRTISTGGPLHPYGEGMWPIDGIGIGYGELKIIECYDFIKAIAEHKQAVPDFRHGWKIAKICDAVAESSRTGTWVSVE